MKRLLTFLLLTITLSLSAQEKKPKLVVGIVVDQMRYEYLQRFYPRFGENGFKKILKNGFDCRNTHYNYVPTYTGPGHASIYTGATPSTHGIIANDWYDRTVHRDVYCAEDRSASTVGAKGETGMMSPGRLISNTIGDEIKLATNGKGKVIGIALKDRAAILPAGRAGDGAFWFDDQTGNFITSTWYMENLPQWVMDLNAKKYPEDYVKKKWETLYPVVSYTASIADDQPFERILYGEEKPVFPHDIAAAYSHPSNTGGYGVLKFTPWGNTLTRLMAEAAIKGNSLGKDDAVDLLAVSFSSPDYIGHMFGPRSVETEDCYLRLDKEMEQLITFLEKEVGKDNFVLFLTADHAVADIPSHLNQQKLNGGTINLSDHADSLNNLLLQYFPLDDTSERFVRSISNQQVYLNRSLITENKFKAEDLEKLAAEYFRKLPGVANVITRSQLLSQEYARGWQKRVQMGYNERRSGDIIINLEPGWFEGATKGTTHGSPYPYDTHVPLVFYGGCVKAGHQIDFTSITDIAPTLARLIHVTPPNGCTGKEIKSILE